MRVLIEINKQCLFNNNLKIEIIFSYTQFIIRSLFYQSKRYRVIFQERNVFEILFEQI